MKQENAKRYAIFALLLICSVSWELWMDVLQRLSPNRMLRNMTLPFMMFDPIENTILAVLLIMFVRKPLAALFLKLLPKSKSKSSS
jgi:hypothetical protein